MRFVMSSHGIDELALIMYTSIRLRSVWALDKKRYARPVELAAREYLTVQEGV